MDNDGGLEIIAGSSNDAKVHVLKFNGTRLTELWSRKMDGKGVGSIVVGGLAQNGKLNVIASTMKIIPGGDIRTQKNSFYVWNSSGAILNSNWPLTVDGAYISVRGTSYSPNFTNQPILADVNNDNLPEIIISGGGIAESGESFHVYDLNARELMEFHKPVRGSGDLGDDTFYNSPAVGNFAGTGYKQILCLSNAISMVPWPAMPGWFTMVPDYRMYLWDTNSPIANPAPWPMIDHDNQHTGAIASTALLITKGGVNTSYQPWAVWLRGNNFTSDMKARLFDGNNRWGEDIPVTLAADKASLSFKLPANKLPSGANTGKKADVGIRLVSKDGLVSRYYAVSLPAVK
jgi:hypothetical protein